MKNAIPHPDPTVWKARRRANLPQMTKRMYDILVLLRDSKQAGFPFVALPNIHKRTLNALTIERDWMKESPGLDGVKYIITLRGERALTVYEKPTRRFDKICPTCNVRPKHVNEQGYEYGYCLECYREHGRKQFALKGWQADPGKPCSRCKKRKRHTFPSGKTIAYCAHCRKVKRRQEKKRKHARLLARIAAGELLPCPKCGAPRYHTKKVVYDLCYMHYREYQTAYQADYMPKFREKQQQKAERAARRAAKQAASAAVGD